MNPSAILIELFGQRTAPDGSLIRENFASWFGGSKIADSDGRPRVVYHGTLNDFSEFKLGYGEAQSRGFFFTNKENVNGYLWSYLDASKYQEVEREGNHTFMPVYLSIKNPKLIDTTETGEWADPDSENAVIAKAKTAGHDGLIIEDHEAETVFYVAFRPEQIKSAIGNSGAYSINDRDMTDRKAIVLANAMRAAAVIGTSAMASPLAKPG